MLFLGLAGTAAGIFVAAWASRRAVSSALAVADALAVPLWLVGVTVMAVGTDLPEIANFDYTAIRRGAPTLAMGDLFGSSLVDATLSIGIGPLVAATVLSTDTAVGNLIAAAAVAATAVVARRRRHSGGTATMLLLIYVGAMGLNLA